jgi:uncharacterized protein (UPF0332 family)
MSDAADSMVVAQRFAALARKNDPSDYEVVIHTTYYSMHHAAPAALLAANRSAPTNHGRVIASFARLTRRYDAKGRPLHGRILRAAYDLRMISDYGRAQRDLTSDAGELSEPVKQLSGFLPESRRPP